MQQFSYTPDSAVYLWDVFASVEDVDLFHGQFTASLDVVTQKHLTEPTDAQNTSLLPVSRCHGRYQHRTSVSLRSVETISSPVPTTRVVASWLTAVGLELLKSFLSRNRWSFCHNQLVIQHVVYVSVSDCKWHTQTVRTLLAEWTRGEKGGET